MSKKQLVALAVALAVLGTPLALSASASAATISAATKSTATSPIFTDRDDEDDEDDEDESDEGVWGHEDNHSLPPVVIRPHGDDEDEDEDEGDDEYEGDDDEGGFVLPVTPGVDPSVAPSTSPYDSNRNGTGATYSVSPLLPTGVPASPLVPSGSEQVVGANAINPDAAPAIDPASIRTSAKTPADVFMESATWGLVAMGAGALALGSAAGVKTLSARRKPNADYFYDSEN
jgi:Ni/Co efflux regulator RcnB